MKLRTVERALTFLEVIASASEPPKVKEISEFIEVNLSTCYHLQNTLIERGYITKDESGGLSIGPVVARLYHGFTSQLAVDKQALQIVEDLSAVTGENAYLSRLTANGVVVQSVVEAKQAIQVRSLYVGYSGWEIIRASVKAVLAFVSEERLNSVVSQSPKALAELTGSMRAIRSDLDTIRSAGWAIDDEEFEKGVSCCAAPYFGHNGQVLGSISISVPASRFHHRLENLISHVRDAGSELSTLLAHDNMERSH